jgi:biotin synthase
VKWPVFSLDDVLDALETNEHSFKRICVSMTTHPQAMQDTLTIIRKCREKTKLPISGLLTPTVMEGKADLAAVKEAGADRVGIAIDAATKPLFEKFRGTNVGGPHRWERYWNAVDEAIEIFGKYYVGVHLIVGLKETEKEMVTAIDRAQRLGALTHLFSFFPEAGSQMADVVQPTLENYRRIQLARYLINEGLITGSQVEYDSDERIIGYGIDIEPHIEQGLAFMTSGCPGTDGFLACNRPFGNERASKPFRNYPFIPEPEDITLIRSQVNL